jgi:RNA polymerase sigma factor (sigma-70 family)
MVSIHPLSPVEELNLVKLAVSGDHDAFERIYFDNNKKVLALFINLTRNLEDAEDLSSETFLKVFNCLHTFRGDAKLSSWIHRIAINIFLMSVRPKKNKYMKVSLSEIKEPIVESNALSYIQFVEVMKIVSRLPEEAQVLLLMRLMYGYTNEETSNLLSIAETTTKSYLHRTRKKIRMNYSSRSVACQ